MGVAAIDKVWKCPIEEETKFFVYLQALADWSDDNLECYPGGDALAKKARCSRRTITRFNNIGSGLGLLEIKQKKGKGKSNHYKMDPYVLAKITDLKIRYARKCIDIGRPVIPIRRRYDQRGIDTVSIPVPTPDVPPSIDAVSRVGRHGVHGDGTPDVYTVPTPDVPQTITNHQLTTTGKSKVEILNKEIGIAFPVCLDLVALTTTTRKRVLEVYGLFKAGKLKHPTGVRRALENDWNLNHMKDAPKPRATSHVPTATEANRVEESRRKMNDAEAYFNSLSAEEQNSILDQVDAGLDAFNHELMKEWRDNRSGITIRTLVMKFVFQIMPEVTNA